MVTDLQLDIKEDILRKEYDLDRWVDLVKYVFKSRDIFPIDGYEPVLTGIPYVKRGFQYGLVYLSDNHRLALVNIELTDTKVIAHNRVELRNMAARLITGSFSGVLAAFHTPGQPDYRLSLITKTSEFNKEGVFVTEHTYPKRYTYLLGPNESCTTAARQLTGLAENARPTLDDVTSAFSVEKVSNEFFKEYRYHYEKKFLPQVEKLADSNNKLFQVTDKLSEHERLRFNALFVNKNVPLTKLAKLNTDFENDTTTSNQDKHHLKAIQKELGRYMIHQYEESANVSHLLDKVQFVVDFYLNKNAHSTTSPNYEEEVREALDVVKRLNSFINKRKGLVA